MEGTRLPWINEDAIIEANSIIYHYTNVVAFRKILESDGVLATHYKKTNDRDEFVSLRQPVSKEMIRLGSPIICKMLSDRGLKLNEERAHELAEHVFIKMVETFPLDVHISCFSVHEKDHHKKNGLLTMWRLYGGGGEGVALGFNAEAVRDTTEEILKTEAIDYLYLDRVYYGLQNQEVRKRMKEADFSEILCDAVRLMIKEDVKFDNIPVELMHKFLVLCAASKNEDFEDEREVRLVAIEALDGGEHGRERVKKYNGRPLIRYLNALEEIIVGPSVNQEELYVGVKQELDKAGLNEVRVRKSKTPFRETTA